MKSVHVPSYSSPYSVQMRENMGQNNSKYGYFLCIGLWRDLLQDSPLVNCLSGRYPRKTVDWRNFMMRSCPATTQKQTNNQALKFELNVLKSKKRGLRITNETRNQIMQWSLKCLQKYSLKHGTEYPLL